jgi:hypothetical protein
MLKAGPNQLLLNAFGSFVNGDSEVMLMSNYEDLQGLGISNESWKEKARTSFHYNPSSRENEPELG